MPVEQLQHLLTVCLAYLIAVASPGPSTMAIMGANMAKDVHPPSCSLGVVSGSMFWGVLAATGLSTVLAAWAPAIFAIKICGGLYLLWLAWKSAKSALTPTLQRVDAISGTSNLRLYRKGLLLHLTNPKAILGWIAIMSLGVGPDSPTQTMAAVLGGCAALGLMVNLCYVREAESYCRASLAARPRADRRHRSSR